jgi:SseB protein C-terminal domain/SseB protein N-terminal domain
VSKNAFRPENALEEELLYAFESRDERALLATLAIADLYLPSDEAPEHETELVAEPGDAFPLTTVTAPDGTAYVAAFSSLRQLAYVRPEGGGYRRIRGRTLAAIAPRDLGLALNPSGELGFPLTPAQFAAIVDVPPPEDGESGYLIGEPKEEPAALLDAMRRMADGRTDVRALYRVQVVRAPGAAPEALIGLELDAGVDARPVIDAAVEAGRTSGIERLGLVPLQPGIDSGAVGRFMLEQTQPFWTR